MSYIPILFKVPTYVDVLKYMSNHKIEYTLDPSPRCKSFEEVHTPENMEFARNSIMKLMDDMYDEEKEEVKKDPSIIRRIFRRI